MTPNQKKTSTWLAITVSCVGIYEGCRLYAYPDIVGVWTVCYGETKNVNLGMRFSKNECDEMLSKRLQEFNNDINKCLKVDIPDTRRAAFVSLAYNIGSSAFCKSTTLRKINEGDVKGSCEAMLLFNKAGGKVVQGLVNRRTQERELCLVG